MIALNSVYDRSMSNIYCNMKNLHTIEPVTRQYLLLYKALHKLHRHLTLKVYKNLNPFKDKSNINFNENVASNNNQNIALTQL